MVKFKTLTAGFKGGTTRSVSTGPHKSVRECIDFTYKFVSLGARGSAVG
jgi:hypothetical protein